MANEEIIDKIRRDIEDAEEACGVRKLKDLYSDTLDKKNEFGDLSQELREEVRKMIFRVYRERGEGENDPLDNDGRVTIDGRWTIKTGSVYHYGSSQRSSIGSIADNIELFDLLTDEEKELVKDAELEINNSLSDRTDKVHRVLIDDERDFDAAKYVTSGYSSGLKLIDLKEGRSCSGETVDLSDDYRNMEVKTIYKTIQYQPELLEVVQKAHDQFEEAVESRKSVLERLEEVRE